MPSKKYTRLTGLVLVCLIGVSACGSATTTAASLKATTGTTAGAPPGAPPGGSGGAGGSSAQITAKGAYVHSTGTTSASGKTYGASAANTSGVLNTGGSLTLDNAAISTRGTSSSSDQSSFYGLDAGVLAKAGSLTMNGGSVTTTGDGANGIFAYGSGTTVTLSGTRISATGRYAHGIMASGGGTIKASNVTASTTNSNGAVIATDRGGGTITVSGGSYSTSGTDSPGIYSTGRISVTGATVKATGAEAAVIEGSNSVSLTGTSLSGAKKWGVMIYQSFSGDAQGSTGTWTQTGGSLSAAEGPLFHVTNATGVITLHGVTTSATSGVLLKAGSNKWGTSGANGGKATLVAITQKLSGSVIVDKISSTTLKLTNGSAWTGAIDTAHTAKSATVSLDSTSTWTVTATSYLTSLTGVTVSGSKVTNIVGNGHIVYYNKSANSNLAGKTYTLTGGGTLQPA
jgi:hypothetical protein